ncbi:MAG: RluA family pseudouridine synthase [Holosporaceae bacterium]|jgi:23S rRNA pseudouridine955/2504/2580 synthase|nr:RluA family pseudouridine synthase [Holosporaceae bacterium]
MFEYIVTDEDNGVRADRIVKRLFPRVSFGLVQKQFRLKKIRANDRRVEPTDRLCSGDRLQLFANLREAREKDSQQSNRRLLEQLRSMVIYENDDFFAINKPTKLATQLGTKVSFCVETLIKSYPGCNCHLVHRLDRDTSGVLLIAKNRKYACRLAGLFRENRIKKTYLAVVGGYISQSGRIDTFLKKTFVRNEERMVIADDGQMSITLYTPLKSVNQSYTLLELKPLTGRKHQLRVHCADFLGTPILGDRKYNTNAEHSELLLHAFKVALEDCSTEIIAPIPRYFNELMSCDIASVLAATMASQ